MEQPISISNLNDFIFCPISIYFHNIYGNPDNLLMKDTPQINGSAAHEKVDNRQYADSQHILQGISIYCEQYNLIGKIDIFDTLSGILTERKNKIKTIYDGYVFQLYAQCFALREMGYSVKKLRFQSYSDNKVYPVPLPEENNTMFKKFEALLRDMETFDYHAYYPSSLEKCANCIYIGICDRPLLR